VDYDEIGALRPGWGVIWQGGTADASIRAPPFSAAPRSMAGGGNVYLKCGAGASRAAYIDVAVHCRALGISAEQAVARIRARRPATNPNYGFLAQLHRLWP